MGHVIASSQNRFSQNYIPYHHLHVHIIHTADPHIALTPHSVSFVLQIIHISYFKCYGSECTGYVG